MAVTQVYTAVPGDTITAARWNNEFGNIYNNGTNLAFPLTTSVSFNGQQIRLDAAGASIIESTTSQGLHLIPGAKSGAVNFATGHAFQVHSMTMTDTSTAGSGTATAATFVNILQPTLAAANASVACTNAATLYIEGAPANGTNETITNPWAIWVDAGAVRFDGNLTVSGTVTSKLPTPFVSGDHTPINVTTVYSDAHGLSSVPVHWKAYLRNTSTELNYVSGDKVDVTHFYRSAGGYGHMAVNATNVYYIQNGEFSVNDLTTGALTAIDETKWKLVLEAWN